MTTFRMPTPEFHFRTFGAAYIVPADTVGAKNLVDEVNSLRVRYIQVLATGTITFRHKDDTLSVPIPVSPGQSYEIGTAVVHIMATDTSLSNVQIIPYWA